VTDFAFPQQAGPITGLSVELQKRLQQATIEVVNGIDATCSGDCLVEKLSSGIQPAVVVWGSPQPNVLSVRKPEVTLDAANTSNADYKQLIFQMLSNHFPDSEVFIPLPNYYNIEENNYEMDLAPIRGIYAPMASTDIQRMQLCHPHQVRVLSSMKPVNGRTNVLELRKCLQEACKRRPDRPICFFGEFTCTLSYTCLINE